MGAPGGAVYMGKAYSMLAQGLREALSVFGKTGFANGLPVIGDAPLLIKALSVNQPGIPEDAHQALVWLTGQDLGREPGPWQQWWEANRESFARQQAEEAAAGDLFRQFRGNVLLGRWDAALAAVSTGATEGASPENLQRELAGLAQTLRTAYRASSVQGLRLRAAEGVLIIDWGRKGFEFDELPLVRQAEGWRFACRPWDVRLVKKPRKPVQTSPLEFHMRHRRRSVFASAGNWKFFLALLGIVAAFGTAGLLAHAYGGILEGIFGYLFAGLIIVAPTALIIYSFYFGRPKAPRRLPCDRNHHHPHHPNAS